MTDQLRKSLEPVLYPSHMHCVLPREPHTALCTPLMQAAPLQHQWIGMRSEATCATTQRGPALPEPPLCLLLADLIVSSFSRTSSAGHLGMDWNCKGFVLTTKISPEQHHTQHSYTAQAPALLVLHQHTVVHQFCCLVQYTCGYKLFSIYLLCEPTLQRKVDR